MTSESFEHKAFTGPRNFSGFVWKKVELTSKNVKRGFYRLYIYINTHSPLLNVSLSLFLPLFVFQRISLTKLKSFITSVVICPSLISEARGVMSIHNSWFHKGRRKNCVWTISSGPPSLVFSHSHTWVVRWMALFAEWRFQVAI